jgi:lactate permease
MSFLLALFPIALILVLMVGLRWGAARAGAAGYLVALLIAAFYFGAGIDLLAYAHAKALLLSIDVLLIIWAAFLLYRVADEAGAIRTIGQALPHLTNDIGMQALIIGWVFASFLQGVGGFGVPVAVIAPLLVSLGFAPLAAVVIPSIGHGWAVTFGSLGSSFQALMAATGLPANVLGIPAAVLLGIAGLITGWMVAHAAQSWIAVKRLFWPVVVIGVVMGIILLLMVASGLWNFASFVASIGGLLVCYPLAKRFRGADKDNGKLDLASSGGFIWLYPAGAAYPLVQLLRR